MPAFARSTIAAHAVLETATDFVPIPFVGGLLAKKVHQRLVVSIGAHHGVPIGAGEAAAFTRDRPEGVLRRAARGAKAVVLAPLRGAFAGVFAVVGADAVAAAVGKRYARGLAVDVALDEGLARTEGLAEVAAKVVDAVERVETRPTRRLAHRAFRTFERSLPAAAARLEALFGRATERVPSLASKKLPVTSDEREELRTALLGARATPDLDGANVSDRAAPAR